MKNGRRELRRLLTTRQQVILVTPTPHVQVSLDVQSVNGAKQVIPYVVAIEDAKLGYDLKVFNVGPSGRSTIAQSGSVSVQAGKRIAVSSVTVTPQVGGKCEADLTLSQGGNSIGHYALDCSAK
jgi:hypothetical protein